MNQKGEHQQDPLEGRLAGRRIETGRRRVSGLNSRKKNGFLWRSSEAPLHPREAGGQKEIAGEAPPRDPRCPVGRPKLPASTLGDDARRSTRDAGEARGARPARGQIEQGVAGAARHRPPGVRGAGLRPLRRDRSAAGPERGAANARRGGARTVPLRPRGGPLRQAGKPREAAMVSPDAGAAQGGGSQPAGRSRGAWPRTPRPAVGSPGACDLQAGGNPVILTGRETPNLPIPPRTIPPALGRRRRPRRA